MTALHRPDVVALSKALSADLEGLTRHAVVPPAAAVWFRAERRARLEALRRAEQPMWFAERLALVGGGVVIGWMGTLATSWLKTHAVASSLAALSSDVVAAIEGPMAGLGLVAPGALALGVLALGVLALSAGVFAAGSAD